MHRRLTEDKRRYLREKRGLADEVIDRYRIGWNGERFTISIADEAGKTVNVRQWLQPEKRKPDSLKMLNVKGCGKPPRLFPVDRLRHDPSIITEGELDALAAISEGFHGAITITGGATTWPDEASKRFREKHCILISDQGAEGVQKRAASLALAGARVAVATWPGDRPDGWDVTDELLTHGRDSLARILGNVKEWRHPALINLADVKSEPVSWFWKPYLADKKLNGLWGDPGCGKSYMSLALACLVSTGGTFPDGQTVKPGNVLLLSTEDGLSDTVKPRIEKMGGDPGRITAVNSDDFPLHLSEKGADALDCYMSMVTPRLLIVDPIQAFLGDCDMFRSNEVRPILDRLAALTLRRECCTLVIGHLTKANQRAIAAGSGSMDFAARYRSILLAGVAQDGRRGFVHVKCNIEAEGKSQGYSIGSDGFFWKGESDLTKEDLLGGFKVNRKKAAEDFLLAFLSQGERPVSEIEKGAKERGIKKRTLDRAKKAIGAESGKDGLDGWVWFLPGKGAKNAKP